MLHESNLVWRAGVQVDAGIRSPPAPPAPLAQLDRASDFGSEGWGFESLRAHRFSFSSSVLALSHVQVKTGRAIS